MNLNEKVESMSEKIMPLVTRISENRFLQGLSAGMMATLPITIVGSSPSC